MAESPTYPSSGCIVEFLEGNTVHIAFVMEETAGKTRLLLPSRRELKLAASRILPWIGPVLTPGLGRDEAARALAQHKEKRDAASGDIPLMDLWEMAQGEVSHAPAKWFAELMETAPDIDTVAAYGRALLACKSHFRFQAPDFLVYDAGTVEKRLAEQKSRAEKEALVSAGSAFLRRLWDAACKNQVIPAPERDGQGALVSDENVARRMEKLLFSRVANPESQDDAVLWQMLAKGLPDVPHLPLQLLMAWGKLPGHYNFWLDRAGYDPGDAWWSPYAEEVNRLAACGSGENSSLQPVELPFLSIDSAKTRDIDDAFHIERAGAGWRLTLALACPALAWPFGGGLDKTVLRRGTSIYLPEGDLHMLPEILGTEAYSLHAARQRPVFCLRLDLDESGAVTACEPFAGKATLAANLNYQDVQAVLEAMENGSPLPDNPARAYSSQLALACGLAARREALRISRGAIVMDRPEPLIRLDSSAGEVKVDLYLEPPAKDAQRLVAEMMILASSALAQWAGERKIPLLHRTQHVAVPKEYAGIWSRPEDISKIMRALIPSSLEVAAKPHAALALARYAPVTSPLRRYPDMINEAQILRHLEAGCPRWNEEELSTLLESLAPALDAVGHAQRFRPRYWKLLYFRQQGDKAWWNGVITEENENFVSVTLPDQGLFVRGKRTLFDDRAYPGLKVRLRLGKVNPLYNEIHILEALPAD